MPGINRIDAGDPENPSKLGSTKFSPYQHKFPLAPIMPKDGGRGLRLAFDPPCWQVARARFLNDKLPGVRFLSKLDWTKLSHDKAHLDSLEDLDLGLHFVTVRMYFETLKTAEALKAPIRKMF